METLKLEFLPPDENTPGYPRRIARILYFQEMMTSGSAEKVKHADWTELVEFLSAFVKAETPEQAKDLLWNCTQKQFGELLSAAAGNKTEEVVPPTNGGGSVSP